jgi:hypothetical protein
MSLSDLQGSRLTVARAPASYFGGSSFEYLCKGRDSSVDFDCFLKILKENAGMLP